MKMTRDEHVGYFDLVLNLATFQYIDGFGCYLFFIQIWIGVDDIFLNVFATFGSYWDRRLLY